MNLENIQITNQCVKEITNIGSTTYQNICNGNVNIVPWGVGEWLSGIVITILVVAATAWLIVMVKMLRGI